jgi:nicotinate dehydrogenase subunit B
VKPAPTPTTAAGIVPPRPSGDELLYGATLRPPRFHLQNGRFDCSRLLGFEQAGLPETVRIVTCGSFVGVVAAQMSVARHSAARLAVTWENPAADSHAANGTMPQPVQGARSDLPDTVAAGDHLTRQYGWPNRLRWGSCADWVIAAPSDNGWRIWAPSQSPALLCRDLAALLDCAPDRIEIVGAVTAGIGRTCADDAAADAALMARQTGGPVAVWLSADYQPVVDALGDAQRIDISASHDNGGVDSFDYRVWQSWNSAPALALLLTGSALPDGTAEETASDSPYDFGRQRMLTPQAIAGAYRSAQQAELQDSFARESFVDELAGQRGEDPLAFRRRHLRDARGRALLEAAAAQAGWREDTGRGLVASPHSDIVRGRGVAYAHVPVAGDESDRGIRSVWIADIEVNRVTGAISVGRIVVGQDSGATVDTGQLRDQLQRELLAQSGQLLEGRARWDQWGVPAVAEFSAATVAVVSSAAIPDAAAPAAPALRCDQGLMVPAVAALANALHHATGIRLRKPPFSANRILDASVDSAGSNGDGKAKRRSLAGAMMASAVGVLVITWPWKAVIDPVPRPAPNLYSAATIERGRLVAAAGDCAVCHTRLHGVANTGGRPFKTPFGTLYSTNITPDETTGIGNWSFAAFDRAMRSGISRDGRHLYPAFPYTAFAKISDGDMQALYAYLMAQPAARAETPAPAMNFPFNYRPALAAWNALFLDPRPFAANPARSDLWNRGAYLAEGLGHCSACHSPRNVFGAEQGGRNYFAGAVVDGWEAPPLNALSRAPVPWTEEALFQYLREGKSDQHGVAAGPMAPVVAGLMQLPEQDVRAIAHYVASYSSTATAAAMAPQTIAAALERQTDSAAAGLDNGARLYESGCAACHEARDVRALTDAQVALALNTNLHSDRPDNLIRTILYGVQTRSLDIPAIGVMPGFEDSLNDRQIVELAAYLRHRFAPDKAAWQDLDEKVTHCRQHAGSH